jgi:uncharacterized protein (DUF433 family)
MMMIRKGNRSIRGEDMAIPEITRDPNVLAGKPVIAGTRISVELILNKLGAGDSVADVLADYPHLTRNQILAAVRYAATTLPPGAGGAVVQGQVA